MKHVTLKRMSFVYFKGFKDYTIDFYDRTTISGSNGQGKTTIFDGFTWVLFGKDSQNRAEFDVKTKEDGVVIPRVPHEVTAVLDVNGEEVTLTRRYNEVWRSDKDSNGEEVFKGHETERLYNGVPCSVKEWQEKIDAIVKEEIFKYTTDPRYFSSQKPEVQRQLLFKMAGGVTDAEIIESTGEFRKLFDRVGNKTLAQFEEEIKASLARVRKELSDLPARIDERKRDEVIAEDWAALEAQVADRTKELQEVDGAIADKAKAITAASEARATIARELDAVNRKRTEREREIKNKAYKEYHTRIDIIEKAERQVAEWEQDISLCNSTIDRNTANIADIDKEREQLLAEYDAINSETLTFDESQFVCQTCGRQYEADDIEAKQTEMTERFNADKANRLALNKKKGLAVKERKTLAENIIVGAKRDIERYKKSIEDIKVELIGERPVEPAYEELIIDDAEYAELTKQVGELKKHLSEAPTEIADTELQERKRTLTTDLVALKFRLAKREQIRKNAERIAELENQNRNLGEEEANLKGLLYAIKEFSKARSRAISDRVNGLFKFVRFKLFETQVNGEEVEVCEATMHGVPYSVLSNGEKIVAGLDIIRGIQKHVGVSAPLFVDNAEAVSGYPSGLLDDFGQVVFLRVTEDDSLTVKHTEE